MVFTSPEELFAFLAEEWLEIPNEVIERFWSSFHARLQVCAAHKGECLNGHWKEVHRVHHPEERSQEPEALEHSHDEEEDKVEGGESDWQKQENLSEKSIKKSQSRRFFGFYE
jgi:hypothetical protein